MIDHSTRVSVTELLLAGCCYRTATVANIYQEAAAGPLGGCGGGWDMAATVRKEAAATAEGVSRDPWELVRTKKTTKKILWHQNLSFFFDKKHICFSSI